MTDSSRTAARDLFTQAADAGVAPMLLTGSPWAIRQDVLPQIAAAMHLQADALAAMRSAAPASQAQMTGVVTIPLTGIITPQGSFFDFLFGGAPGGLLGFRESFREALASPDVSAIIIDVDSPGGLVDLVPETAAEVRAARGAGKPIVAVADTQMCSAAYWIASQADEIVATTSGVAGSIGVYRLHVDLSRLDQDTGVAFTYVHAGEHKVEGNPHEPLAGEALEQWQADVDEIYALFVADVAAGRGISEQQVLDGLGQGRAHYAGTALTEGIVDRIATYDEVRAGLAGRKSTSSATSALSAEQLAELRVQISADVMDPAALRAALGLPEPTPEADPALDGDDGAPEADDDAPAPSLSDDERAAIAALLLA